MNPVYQSVPNPAYTQMPSQAYQSPNPSYQTPGQAYQSPNPSFQTSGQPYQSTPNLGYQQSPPQGSQAAYQTDPRKENIRPSVHVMQAFSSSEEKPGVTETHLDGPRPRSRRRRLTWHIFSHLIGFLWLAPIAALLVLNYKGHVIGASVWCPMGKCSSDAFATDSIARKSKLDRDDHNALGALQFVAKALEIWFMIIATAFVYDVAMIFAKKGGGLPVGYLLTHLEFSDVRNLFNPLMWTSAIPHKTSTAAKRPAGFVKLYLFALLAAFLTILTNLMGPATAVLVLPTLQWIDTAPNITQIFNRTGAADFPGANKYTFPDCTVDQLGHLNYSCTYGLYGSSLDTWADGTLSSRMQSSQDYGRWNFGVSQEGDFDFTLNFTTGFEVAWVPNRQVLRLLSYDLQDLSRDVYGSPDGSTHTTAIYNNSLTTILQRKGPSIGLQTNCYNGNITFTELANDRYVLCFSGWTNDAISYYTKCVPVGWTDANLMGTFTLQSSTSKKNDVSVYTLFSEKATFFNDTEDFGSGIAKCIGKTSTAACDWDRIFDTTLPSALRNSSINTGITAYQTAAALHASASVWCDQVSYLGFPTYQFDTSSSSAANLIRLVQLNNLTDPEANVAPLVVNPYWLLAAWSIESNGTVSAQRPMARELSRIVPTLYTTPWDYNNLTANQMEFVFLHIYTMSQSLSMVHYWADNVTASTSQDNRHPFLNHYATLRVWAFGFSSRTSKLGIAVVLAGSACVLVRLALGFWIRGHEHSPVELFVAALEHQHQYEFHGLKGENEWAKVRYQMDNGPHGKPAFMPDRIHYGTPHIP